jgi:hypothetical protein
MHTPDGCQAMRRPACSSPISGGDAMQRLFRECSLVAERSGRQLGAEGLDQLHAGALIRSHFKNDDAGHSSSLLANISHNTRSIQSTRSARNGSLRAALPVGGSRLHLCSTQRRR